MKKTPLIGLLTLALVAGGLLQWRAGHLPSPGTRLARAANKTGGISPWMQTANHLETPDAASTPNPTQTTTQPISPEDRQKLQAAYDRLTPEDKQAVVQTTAYIDFMTRMRAILESRQPVHLSQREADDLAAQTDRFMQENYFSVNQAFEIKAALMRDAYQGEVLSQRLAALQQQATQQYEALKAQSDPSQDPTFRAFKAEQSAMIAQANHMGTFPNGMSRDQYIIQESERIRARYYTD
jgi:hypothetical protein